MSNGLGKDAFTRKFIIWPWPCCQGHTKFSPVPSHIMLRMQIHLQENTLFDIDFGVRVTRNVAQDPLHRLTYAAVKFEVA